MSNLNTVYAIGKSMARVEYDLREFLEKVGPDDIVAISHAMPRDSFFLKGTQCSVLVVSRD